MDKAMQLLDNLTDILNNSRPVPFSDKVQVDKTEICNIINSIKAELLSDLKQPKKL